MPGSPADITFGLPAQGYADSTAKQFLPGNKLCETSENVLYDPVNRAWRDRLGTNAWEGITTGFLESKHSFQCRRARSFPMRSFSTSHAVGGIFTGDAGFGCFAFVNDDMAGAGGQQTLGMIGSSFDAEHVVGSPGAGRGKTAAHRAVMFPETYDFRAVQSWLFIPGYGEIPRKWNMGIDTLGSEGKALYPWGDFPPARMPRISHVAAAEHATIGKFTTGNYFAVAICGIKADGSYTQPLVPKLRRELDTMTGTPQSTCWSVAGGWDTEDLGYYLVGGASTFVQACRVYDIPIGPPDWVGRVLFRTLQASSIAAIDLTTMSVWEVINDNKTTEIRSHKGDGELSLDPAVYRLDHMMAPRAKFITVHEQRVWVAHCKPSNIAFAVCPNVNSPANGSSSPGSFTYDGVAYTNLAYTFRIFNTLDGDTGLGGSVEVRIELKIGPPGGAATTTTLNINAGEQTTIEDVIDYFNSLVTAENTVGATVDAGVHFVAAPNFPVRARANCLRSTVQGVDQGDNSTFSGGPHAGSRRAFSNAFYACAYVSDSRMGWDAEERRQRRAIYFTGGGPLHAPNAANSFYVGNIAWVPEEAGEIVGIGSTRGGLVSFCSEGAYVTQNIRDVSTNEDRDFVTRELNKQRKFIAPDSVCEGPGWCVALSTVGLIATAGDPLDDVNISLDIYNDNDKRGSLTNEVAECAKATSLRDNPSQKCRVSNDGSSLFLTYRRSGDTRPTRVVVYPYGAAKERKGLGGLLDDQGQPFGWSAPCSYNSTTGLGGCGPICEVVRNLGGSIKRRLFMFTEYVGSTGDGLLVEIESTEAGYEDESATAYTRMRRFPPFIASADLRAFWLEVFYGLATGGTASARFLLGAAEELSGLTYVLDIGGGPDSMRNVEFDAHLNDRLHVPRLALEVLSSGSGGLTLWGARAKASQHLRRS